jgi:hypothetical protein
MNNLEYIDNIIYESSKNIVISGGFDLEIKNNEVSIDKEKMWIIYHLGWIYDEKEVLNLISEKAEYIDIKDLKRGAYYEFKALLKWDSDDYRKWLYIEEIEFELVKTIEAIEREQKIFQILEDNLNLDFFKI